MRRMGTKRVALIGAILALLATGSAWAAFRQLPPGAQVNDDIAAGIDPANNVAGGDPTNADVVGGALTAGKPGVPWAIFQQETATQDQIFVRSFANGAWTTRGHGTVGGRSDASPTFPGSLNFDRGTDGEVPAIDFAGAGRTTPWATWYEDTSGTGFGANNVFASRFDAVQNKWIFAGQGRGTGGTGPQVPSLNLHTDQAAENPSVAGGSLADPTKPGPWVTWQETTTAPAASVGNDQIFVERPVGPAAANCNGVKPAAQVPANPPVGGFCWQQVGVERVGPATGDPSLNVDRTRDGIEPDIAFTGPNDSVPWVVWYETGGSGAGLNSNDMVFAAKGVAPGTPTGVVDGGLNWVTVGGTGQGVLDNSAGGGPCGATTTEAGCSINKVGLNNAEDPRVAAGTMNPANPTVPWVTWTEEVGGTHQIFVSRLVGAGAAAHFELVNNGAPISIGANDSVRPDITFSGNTPYVSWREDIGGGVAKAFTGHFVNAANPTFVLDSTTPVSVDGPPQADVREPISSSCIATPFNGDGAACQGGAVGTPFFLFTNGTSPRRLFADQYQTDAPATNAASAVTSSAAAVSGSVNPQGAPVKVEFQFGTTTAYGSTTAAQKLGPANSATAFAAVLSGLPPATTIHYRALAITDFGTVAGNDRVVTTAGAPDTTPPKLALKISKTTIKKLRSGKALRVKVTISEAGKVSLTSSVKVKIGKKTKSATFGSKKTVTFTKAGSKTVSIRLSHKAKSLLKHAKKATVTIKGKATDLAGNKSTKKKSATIKRK